MLLLDTNVLSVMMTTRPVPEVSLWMAGYPAESFCTASVCQAEILSGLAVMPVGRRRSDLTAAAQAMFAEDFGGRIWAFDAAAAEDYAVIFETRRRSGRPIATMDLMVAAIARSRGATVVTRNVSDFLDCGVAIANPWEPR